MGFDKVKVKQIRGLILFIALIVLLIMYSGSVFGGLQILLGILTPFMAGGAIAFVLNIPLRFIEKKLLKRWNGKVAAKVKRPICIVLSIIFVIAIITFVILTVVPKLKETFVLLGVQVPVFVKEMMVQLQNLEATYPQLSEWINQLEALKVDWKSVFSNVGNFLTTGMTNVISSAYVVATSIIGGVINAFISIIFAIYILTQKEKLGNQGHRILSAYLPKKACTNFEKVFTLLNRNFSHFISGQCVEAVILGTMFIIAMSIFRLPYAFLIGVLIAFMALIPIVGAFIGCFVGAFLILMNDPIQAVWFIVLFLVIQQIEGNLIYPNVVGGSVGLPSIWVLLAVSIGGSLFGIMGMLCFIPLVSTGYGLMRDSVNERNAKKEHVMQKDELKEENVVVQNCVQNSQDQGEIQDVKQRSRQSSKPNPKKNGGINTK